MMIAHRLSTLRGASRILVLDRSSLVGVGSHEELLVRSPLYREMWETQSLRRSHPAAEIDPALRVERQG
jgi:ABC-type multidrug transport system fused ATPase/permease subunit